MNLKYLATQQVSVVPDVVLVGHVHFKSINS